MFLIHLHLTHQNGVLWEPFDVWEVLRGFSFRKYEKPFFLRIRKSHFTSCKPNDRSCTKKIKNLLNWGGWRRAATKVQANVPTSLPVPRPLRLPNPARPWCRSPLPGLRTKPGAEKKLQAWTQIPLVSRDLQWRSPSWESTERKAGTFQQIDLLPRNSSLNTRSRRHSCNFRSSRISNPRAKRYLSGMGS